MEEVVGEGVHERYTQLAAELDRYFAIRDDAGKYLGCVGVDQDVTEIQKLGRKEVTITSPHQISREEYGHLERISSLAQLPVRGRRVKFG